MNNIFNINNTSSSMKESSPKNLHYNILLESVLSLYRIIKKKKKKLGHA